MITLLCRQRARCIDDNQCPAGRVFQYQVGSGQVLDKIPGSRSGLGWVGVSKYTIRYFQVSFLLWGISGYFGYFRVFRVFLGLPIYTKSFFNGGRKYCNKTKLA